MFLYLLLFQLPIEGAANKLLDYGVIGIMIIFLAFIAFKFYQKIDENSKEWKQQAKDMAEKYTSLNIAQNENNKELIRIRNQDVTQNKEHQEKVERKLDELPEKILKEIQFAELQRKQKPNLTPLD